MKLYKYVSSDRIDVLLNKRIRFTQPSNWNDPFDALKAITLPITKYDKFGILEPKHILAYEKIITDINYLGLSLTENNNNLLMWAHYAENHRGFIIEFDTKSAFFYDSETLIFRDVKYKNDRPALLSIDDSVRFQTDKNYLDKHHEIEVDKLFTKSKEWSYEQEWRVIRPTSALKNIHGETINLEDDLEYILSKINDILTEKYCMNDIFLCDIPDDAITGIYIGALMSDDIKLQLIKKSVDRGFLNIYEATLDNSEYKVNYFKINFS